MGPVHSASVLDKTVYIVTYVVPGVVILLAVLVGLFMIHWAVGVVGGYFWAWIWLHYWYEWTTALKNPEDPR